MKWIKRFIQGWKAVPSSSSRGRNVRHLNSIFEIIKELFK